MLCVFDVLYKKVIENQTRRERIMVIKMTKERKIAEIMLALAGNKELLEAFASILEDGQEETVMPKEQMYLACVSKNKKTYVVVSNGKLPYDSNLLTLQQNQASKKKYVYVPIAMEQIKAIEKQICEQKQQLKDLIDEAAEKLDEAYALVSKRRKTKKQEMLNKVMQDAEYEININTLTLV